MAAGKIYKAPRPKRRPKRRQKKGPIKTLTYSKAKKISVPRISKLLRYVPYEFVRMDTTPYRLTSSSLTFSGDGLDFSLSKLPNFSEFTALFDSYQIVKVMVEFRPTIQKVVTQVDSTNLNNVVVPYMYAFRDLDNSSAPTLDNCAQRQDCIRVPVTRGFTISVVPQVSREVYRSAVSTAYETPYKLVWLDCTQADIPHYGIRYGMEATQMGTADPEFQYQIRVTYWCRFRKVI